MTPLEMFRKICEKVDGAVMLMCDRGFTPHEYGVVRYDNQPLGPRSTLPEEAIEAAYKKLFPPIPRKMGTWEWDGTHYVDMDMHCVLHKSGSGYKFEARASGAALVFSRESLPALIELLDANKDLDEPTEE